MTDKLEAFADRLADLVADRLAERLADLQPPTPTAEPLIDASEAARRLGVDRSYIYDHAAELGAVRLGDGPNARLRFDPDKLPHQADKPNGNGNGSTPGNGRRSAATRRATSSTPLLPIRGER